MERRDLERIEELIPRDAELRRLWEEHRALEQEIGRLNEQRFLTPEEEIRRRELQKRKLAGRDHIQAILARSR